MIAKPTHQTIRRMTYFAAIAEAGSIRGAAAALGLSVPVVSAALSELEEELNVTLAVRTTRSFSLTAAGERVFAATHALLSSAGQAVEAADGAGDAALVGQLSLSVTTEMAAHWLPPILAQFRESHPAVALSVDARDDVVALKTSGFDLAIRAYGPRQSELSDGISQLPLTCVAKTAPKVDRTLRGWAVDAPLLTASAADPVLQAWDRASKSEVSIHFSETIVVTNRDAARKMAMSGLGAALLLGMSVTKDIDQARLAPVLPQLSFGVVCYDIVMRDTLPSREARVFADLVRASAQT